MGQVKGRQELRRRESPSLVQQYNSINQSDGGGIPSIGLALPTAWHCQLGPFLTKIKPRFFFVKTKVLFCKEDVSLTSQSAAR